MTDQDSIQLQLENTDAETAGLLSMSAEETAYAEQFAQNIDIMNTVQILKYGSVAQKRMSDFMDSDLRSLPTDELEEVSDELRQLIKVLQKFGKDFDRQDPDHPEFMTLYDRTERSISEVQRRIEIHCSAIIRHVKQLDESYTKVVRNIKEFDLYILAGNKCLSASRRKLPEIRRNTTETERALAVKDYQNAISRFEKKIEDLKTSQQIPLSTLSQIRVIQNNDVLMEENLRKLSANVLPLWQEHMMLSLGLKGTGSSMDPELFHNANDTLIQTLSHLVKIQDDYMDERRKLLYMKK